jgi:hypothetical protein
VASEAIGLRAEGDGHERNGENGDSGCEDSSTKIRSCVFLCGEIHLAVFFPQAKVD